MVEHVAHNGLVVGSNPTKPKHYFKTILNLASLLNSFIIANIIPNLIFIQDEMLKLNFNRWCLALVIHCLFCFAIDIYIIFFKNKEFKCVIQNKNCL